MKNLTLLIAALVCIITAQQELKLGNKNRKLVENGNYFIELKEKLQKGQELNIGAIGSIKYVPCQVYISHESFSTNPGPEKY